MNKKIVVSITLLFICVSSFIGCAKIHVYSNEEFKIFEKDIKTEYPNINKVQVKRIGIEIYISYVLTNHGSDEDIKRLFKTTESFVNKENFTKAIAKEDKADRNSFGRAVMRIINPDVDKKKGTNEIIRCINIKG